MNFIPTFYPKVKYLIIFARLLRVWNKLTGKWDWSRVAKTTNNTFTLDFAVEPDTGLVNLAVSGLGIFYWTDAAEIPPPGNPAGLAVWPDRTAALAAPPRSPTVTYPVFDPTQINQIQVKRVVAMNRVGNARRVGGPSHVHAEPQYDDGSFMFVAVSNAHLRKIVTMAPNVTLSPFALWGPNDTNQTPTAALGATGYDSPSNVSLGAKDFLLANLRPTPNSPYFGGGSQWRVNFLETDCGGTGNTPAQILKNNEYIARNSGYASAAAGLDPRAAGQYGAGAQANVLITGVSTGTHLSRYTQEYVEIWLRHVANPHVHPVIHPHR